MFFIILACALHSVDQRVQPVLLVHNFLVNGGQVLINMSTLMYVNQVISVYSFYLRLFVVFVALLLLERDISGRLVWLDCSRFQAFSADTYRVFEDGGITILYRLIFLFLLYFRLLCLSFLF